MPNSSGPARYLTLDEVATRLGVSARTVLRRINESGIDFLRPGRSYRFTEYDYEKLCEAIRRCRSRSSRRASEKETPSILLGESTPSPGETLRSLRRRETKRLLGNLRERSGKGSRQVVHLDLERC